MRFDLHTLTVRLASCTDRDGQWPSHLPVRSWAGHPGPHVRCFSVNGEL